MVFVSIFLSEILYSAILYIGYQKFTFQYKLTFNLIFSKYHSIFLYKGGQNNVILLDQ